jgi:CubicO group peptidase (beta-lactamase class C family)
MCGVGCETTTLSTTWKDPAVETINFKRVVAVVLNSSPAERRAQEDTLAANIKRATVVPSYLSVPDDLLADRPKVIQRIVDGGFDAALVLQLVDTRHETHYVPPSVSSWHHGWGWGYPGYDSYRVNEGYTATTTFVRAEVSLYAVPSGKLVWAGASETMNPADARAFAKEVLKAAAKELRKQKMLP